MQCAAMCEIDIYLPLLNCAQLYGALANMHNVPRLAGFRLAPVRCFGCWFACLRPLKQNSNMIFHSLSISTWTPTWTWYSLTHIVCTIRWQICCLINDNHNDDMMIQILHCKFLQADTKPSLIRFPKFSSNSTLPILCSCRTAS